MNPKKLNERQLIAIKNPYNPSALHGSMKYIAEQQRDIKHFDSLLTVDILPYLPDIGNNSLYEWHASISLHASIISAKGKPPVFPFVPLMSWSDDIWEDGILICQEMLRNIGIGAGYWTGEPFSLHYRKPLRVREMNLCLEMMR